jgi:diacylglycerol O-acyltransferase
MQAQKTEKTEKMNAMATLCMMLESGINPMSGVGLDLYKIPTGYDGDFLDDLHQALLKTDVAEPFDKIPVVNSLNPLKSYWKPVDNIDVSRHIKWHILPKPGGMKELMSLVEMLISSPLDRSRPLWECHMITGLKGRKFAICAKSHHAILDGTSGMARLTGSKSINPDDKTVRGLWSTIPAIHDRVAKEKPRQVKGLPATLNGLLQSSMQNSSQYTDMFNHIVREVGVSKFIRENYLPSAPGHLPFNAKGDFGKSVAAISFPLAKLKKIGNVHAATVNDVFLAIASGGLYGYLEEKGEIPDSNLIAQVPMSLREPGDIEAGNKVAAMFINLGNPDGNHCDRLSDISRDTKEKKGIARKADKSALMAYTMVTTGLGAVTRMFPDSKQTANITLSNVPGSRQALYLMGAKMEATYAFNVLPPGVSIIMTGFSYNGSMDIGLVAHRSGVPDLEVVTDHMKSAFEQLLKA